MEHIKINDLSVGDWVQARMAKWDYDDPDLTPPMQVVRIDNGVVLYLKRMEHPTFVEDLLPIPILPEILKQNGFSPIQYSDKVYEYNEPNCLVQYFFVNKKLCIRNTNAIDVEIKYIHQLQHALRLASITKEIEL